MEISREEREIHAQSIGIRFPRPAEIASGERGGVARDVIRVAVTTRMLWNSGTAPDAEGLDGLWESHIHLTCRRIKALKGADLA